MKEVYIDGKLYHQMEDSDIEKLPKQEFDKDLFEKYNYDDLMKKIEESR